VEWLTQDRALNADQLIAIPMMGDAGGVMQKEVSANMKRAKMK
jgi:hypothetical protein